MPPSGYLTVPAISDAMTHLVTAYPSICQAIALPEASVEGRAVKAVKLAAGAASNRRGVLLIGGTHARELVPPDLLVSLALRLCQAYTNGTDLVFGPKVYAAGTVKLILEATDIYVIPLLNPDGRAHVQDPAGYAMWRKNRRVNAGSACRGVDLNRNYEFLHASGIGTSTDPCSDIFNGPAAFSEPETRNVRWLLDKHPRIRGCIDVHSFKEKIYHPWGDDASQSTTPAQNFRNHAFDGLRGDPFDAVYKEYILPADKDWLASAGVAMANAIKAVRGRVYGVEPAVNLYPTSGTSKDYAYARHLVDGTKAKVYGYTVECGLEFQPPYAEALNIIKEVSAGLVQFSIQVMCLADAAASTVETELDLAPLRQLRDDAFARSKTGREYLALLDRHGSELVEVLGADSGMRASAGKVLVELHGALERGGAKTALAKEAVGRLDALAKSVAGRSGVSSGLAKAVERARADLPEFSGRPIDEALNRLDRKRPAPSPRPRPEEVEVTEAAD